jgi:serpin B
MNIRSTSSVRFLAMAAGVGLALAGCLAELPTKSGDLPYADWESLAGRVERTNEFAFNLYHQLAGPESNLLVSPHSIALCAAMAYAGAQGTTRQQMRSALCFWHSQEDFDPTMQALTDALLSRGAGQGPDAFRLRIANGCWGADGWSYQPEYLDRLSTYYGAGMQMLDFAGHPDESRDAINQWIADQTEGRVPELLPDGCIDASTYLVLANAVWLKAAWLQQFDPRYTEDRSFTLLDGTIVPVPTMEGEGSFHYHEFEGFRAVELPYVGDEVSMYLILPDAGQFETLEAGFDARRLDEIVADLVPCGIWLAMPKFSFASAFDLVATLQSLGMVDAFGPGANFTGMDGVDDGMPWISDAVHKTFIAVDEYGTEAAAGTGMWLTLGEHPAFDAARPFLFVIRDKPTGTILFLGRVLDPRG